MQKILFILLLLSFNLILSEPNRRLEGLILDNSEWIFDSTNGVYYQIGLAYCSNQVAPAYQTMGIYIPEEYFSCTENSEESGKYTCSINKSGKKGSYTATNAPIVLPVNTPGYAAMKSPTEYKYSDVSTYLKEGLIYAQAGCRGRYDGSETYIAGAPWPITDLKSAVRYLRYNKNLIPGDTERIYTFGMSGGGAQSCLMGITGNSELYNSYLEENGAVMEEGIKDHVKGSQCWCPITNFDSANAAYEWNMGYYYDTKTRAEGTFTKLLSEDFASEFVKYINEAELKDPNGNILKLTDVDSGTYYDYVKKIIEESLNNFLSDTEWPWTREETQEFPRGLETGTTYQNIDEYINYLNENTEWVTYDSSTKTATIKNIEEFVKKLKEPTKDVGAFDYLGRNQGENKLFGTSYDTSNNAKHFDKTMYELLVNNTAKYSEKDDWNSDYPNDYKTDLESVDTLGNDMKHRLNMYSPLYYLNKKNEGYKTSDVANYFRINTGIFQSDTSNAVDINLYLALLNYGKNVKFTTVWEKKHVEAERTGDYESNFIAWIAEIENNFSNHVKIHFFIYILFLLILL